MVPGMSAATETSHRGLILVAEDDPTSRKMVSRLLQSAGFAVVPAEDGGAAVARFADQSVDLVLMDRYMPEVDGLVATRTIRASRRGETVPIIGLTGDTEPEDITACEEAGMDLVLGKPVDLDELLAVIETALAGTPEVTAPRARAAGDETEPDFDPAVMAALMARFGRTGLAELIGAAHESMAIAAAAIASGDAARLARAGHSLKSAASQLGLNALSRACRAVEAAKGDPALGPALQAALAEARATIALNRPDLA